MTAGNPNYLIRQTCEVCGFWEWDTEAPPFQNFKMKKDKMLCNYCVREGAVEQIDQPCPKCDEEYMLKNKKGVIYCHWCDVK